VVEERVIRLKARTVFAVLGILIGTFVVLDLLWQARSVLTWIVIALFLTLALNPLVERLQSRGIRRGMAVAITMLGLIGLIAAIGAAFVPILVDQVRDFSDAVPTYVEDLTKGRGPLGFLETDYHIVERVRQAIAEGGTGRIVGYSGTAIGVAKGVVTVVVAAITIFVLVIFMLLEGPKWVDRLLDQLPPESQERWRRIGLRVNRTVGGYVSGALLIALIAGITSSIVLSVLGASYAIALGLLVALLDLIPLAGATLATVVVSLVAFVDQGWVIGVIVIAVFVLYQQLENHLLYPLVYSRTVELSPLAILIAVLIGASLAGIIGALAAIPVAGTIQVLVQEWLEYRRERLTVVRPTDPPPAPDLVPPL
jgi:predicted PurR-regulated permease PerM